MTCILVEEDPILRVVPVILDPNTPEEHQRAVAEFYAFDEPDFVGWCNRLRARLPGLFPATVVFAKDQNDFRSKISNAEGVIVEALKIGGEEIAAAQKLGVVQKWGGMVANIDLVECARRGVAVNVQRRRVNIAVAEQAFTLMMALAKRICELNGMVEEEHLRLAGFNTAPFDRRYTGNSNFARVTGLKTLNGAVFGAVGLGEIGREVASRAYAFGMKVLYSQRHQMAPVNEWAVGATYCSLAEVLERSDFISIHLPLNPSTKGLLDRKALQRIKKGAILINVARAEIIEREALMEALDTGRLGGFALDVGYDEPARPGEPLLKYKNVILVPHTAPANRRNALDDWEEMFVKMSNTLMGVRRF
jgi:phosphoglycerate dehydrogenase-like enzyme